MLMAHMWSNHLGKDTDALWTVDTRDNFWYKSQHEPIILAIVLPFAYVENYMRTWVAHGLGKPVPINKELEPGFKIAGGRDPRIFMT